MKLSTIVAYTLAMFAATAVVKADSLDDEIAQAKEKFCGGIKVTGPTKGQQFADPTKVQVTVVREPNAHAKTVSGVDIYSIADGKPKYLGTPWKGNYNLNTKASLPVDITKVEGTEDAAQYEFRVWVRNSEDGPDCTLMSQVFRVAASHSNDASYAMQSLDDNIDNGCFGIDLTSPAIGEKVDASKGPISVHIQHDSASPVSQYKSIELFKYVKDSEKKESVHQSWTGKQDASDLFTFKDNIPEGVTTSDNEAFFYKLKAVTQHGEKCEFFSHPFYYE
ncbi:hypothetical protein BDA99DRAFT_503030 [Phascolomyces articulosus]|uniref:Uncharacterized protein n=1 Tax=Phascolomyces articulosus TaxID=60185 RepID=A0AAD5PG97_9FUNG|nr:hypothetical protein BDA99DRAFT_503030 [Phascolomyces articulosus]